MGVVSREIIIIKVLLHSITPRKNERKGYPTSLDFCVSVVGGTYRFIRTNLAISQRNTARAHEPNLAFFIRKPVYPDPMG